MKDETLVLFYYKDGMSAAERRDVEKALEGDPALANRYRQLAAQLDALREPGEVAMPPGLEYRLQSGFERAVRLEASTPPPRRRAFHSWSFVLGAGLTAALAIGIAIGLRVGAGNQPGTEPTVAPTQAATLEWSQAAFRRGLESHLRSARMSLGELAVSEDPSRAALAVDLLDRNRAYQELALRNGAPDLARVLRSFEPMLLQLGTESLSEQDAAALQAQLEFEFSVVLTKLARGTSQETGNNTQELQL